MPRSMTSKFNLHNHNHFTAHRMSRPILFGPFLLPSASPFAVPSSSRGGRFRPLFERFPPPVDELLFLRTIALCGGEVVVDPSPTNPNYFTHLPTEECEQPKLSQLSHEPSLSPKCIILTSTFCCTQVRRLTDFRPLFGRLPPPMDE